VTAATTARDGFSLIELIVALTVLGVGILGLVAAATAAQRSFAVAAAEERATLAAAVVMDSLLRDSAPAAGERQLFGLTVTWETTADREIMDIVTTVEATHGSNTRPLEFHARRLRPNAQ
jgi:prepilin-type N-terminal cleavage/methylation domain-containing protein